MGWSRPDEESRADHDHDHRKNWTGDDVPYRFDVKIATALEIAALGRMAGVTLQQSAELIEQYARVKAGEAACEAIERTGTRILATIEAPLARKEPSDAS